MATIDLWECSRCHEHYHKEDKGSLLTLRTKQQPRVSGTVTVTSLGIVGDAENIVRQDYLCERCTYDLSAFIDTYHKPKDYKHE